MARIASTTTAGVDIPGSGMTLDALMARQKALAAAQAQTAAPRQIQSPWQGAAQLAQAFMGARQEAGVADELSQGRAALAQIMSGIDPAAGPSQEQLAQAYQLDPDLSVRLMEQAAQARREKTLREQTLADRAEGRTYEDTREGRINERELAESQAAAAAANTTENIRNEREKLEAIEAEKRARQAEVEKEERTATHYGPVITGEAATAVGLDPAKSYQKNLKTDQFEPVGGSGGITIQNVPVEAAGRLGLATNFLDQYDDIQAEVDAGNLTGPIDYVGSVMLGRGSAGTAYRTIQSGSDALLRNLTGAGMPAAEAAKYVQRYEPTATDDAPTLHSKLEGLKTDLENVKSAVTAGRKWLPDAAPPPAAGTTPPAAATALPEGVTEDDIAETMRANKMTRQQVLDALAKQGGANGRP